MGEGVGEGVGEVGGAAAHRLIAVGSTEGVGELVDEREEVVKEQVAMRRSGLGSWRQT